MVSVQVILPAFEVRRWHSVLVDRLTAAGHTITVVAADAREPRESVLNGLLAIERLFLVGSSRVGLAARIKCFRRDIPGRTCELKIDLSHGVRQESESGPILTVLFEGRPELSAAAEVLCRGDVPVVDLYFKGSPIRRAAPNASSRVFISRGLDDVLARAITLIVNFVSRYDPTVAQHFTLSFQRRYAIAPSTGPRLATRYVSSTLPRLALRMAHHALYHPGHWRVGYRFNDGPGVVESGSLAGPSWSVLPDDSKRFYADPFPFEWQGRHFIFVEELIHSVGKGVISVAESNSDGCFETPRKVLEEPYHLSYPQVFARDGELWMIPETGGGRKVTLFRAHNFPGDWVEHQVLISGCEIFDATLLDYNGLLWLFGTERDGAGDASDTMVVFFSEQLEGPWRPHPMNPVLIDKSAARPGGSFVTIGDRTVLPVQDGSVCYGGGLGFARLIYLDPDRVELSKPVPIDSVGHWPYPRIHTVNRHGRLETIDGLVQVAKYKAYRTSK